MKEIPLTNGMTAIVDDDSYEDASRFKWMVRVKPSGPASAFRYERSTRMKVSKYEHITMHRHLFGKAEDGLVWDHINGNALDNRRENLRMVTQKHNMWNQHVRRIKDRPVKPKASQYKGVSRYGLVHGKYSLLSPWRARIRVNGKLIPLGWFSDEHTAAEAYNAAAESFFGEYAALNQIDKGVQ